MKKIFASFLLAFLFASISQAQWWVDGGNLLWPYGDVTILKDLNVNGTIKNNGARPYKVYTALLSQTGTDAPVATVLENTTDFTEITYAYDDVGSYRAYFGNYEITDASKVFVYTGSAVNTGYYSNFYLLDEGDGYFGTFDVYSFWLSPDFTTVEHNNWLYIPIEIRVYP